MKAKGSLLAKTVGVLTFFVLLLAFPLIGYAEDGDADFIGRIPASDFGTPLVPDQSTDFEPGTFHINVMAYEQRVVADEKFACIVSYAYSDNSTEAAENPTVVLTLSKEIKTINFYDHNMQPLEFSINTTETGDKTVTFALGASMPSGTLGNIIAVAKMDSEDFESASEPFATASISADNVDTAQANTMTINPLVHTVDWQVMTFKQAPEAVPAPGSEVTYGMTLYGNSEECNLDFIDVTIQVEYPMNAEVADANGGVVDTEARTVTWDFERLLVDDMIEQTVSILYPEAYFTNDEVNTNGKALSGGIVTTINGMVEGSSDIYVLQKAYEHPFDALNVALGDPKSGASFDEDEYCQYDVAVYSVNGIENKGNIAFNSLTVTHTVPEGMVLSYINTGKYNYDVNINIQYKTASSLDWETWATPVAYTNETLHVDDLGLEEPITKVRWVFSEGTDKINPGFTSRDTVKLLSTVTQDYGDYVDMSVSITAVSSTDADTVSASITNTDQLRVMPIWPENLSTKRKQIIETAFTLIGEVEYYLGGKSTVIGWDDRWGTYQYNSNSAKYENYGLDCSGYVVWTLINAGFSKTTVVDGLGLGTYYQWPNCYEISADEIVPGDLAFRQPPTAAGYNHVGIIVGRDKSGMVLVAHCASSYNTVVVTPMAGTFYYLRRPYIY